MILFYKVMGAAKMTSEISEQHVPPWPPCEPLAPEPDGWLVKCLVTAVGRGERVYIPIDDRAGKNVGLQFLMAISKRGFWY